MRNKTLHKRTIEMLRSPRATVGVAADLAADSLRRLPVAAKDRAKKTALLKELKSIDREDDALWKRLAKARETFERLTVEPGTVPDHSSPGPF